MISSAGFFASIPCPLLKAGLCERPHCHFNHGSEKESTASSESLLSQDLDSLIDSLTKSTNSSSELKVSSSLSSSTATPAYVPTPLHKLKQRKSNESTSSGESSSSHRLKALSTYTPTPINELEKSKKTNHKKDESKNAKRKASQDSTSSTISLSSQEDESKNGDSGKKQRLSEDDKSTCGLKNGTSSKTKSPVKADPIDESESPSPIIKIGKERIAHSSATVKKPESKPKRQDSIHDLLMKRYLENATQSKAPASQSVSAEKSPLAPAARVAHTTKAPAVGVKATSRPKYPLDYHKSGSKIPLPMRTRHLDKLIDEYLKLHPTNEAYENALNEEKSIFDRCNKLSYPNAVAKTIIGLRTQLRAKESQMKNTSKTGPVKPNQTVSHAAILDGPQAVNCSIIKRSHNLSITDCPVFMIYKFLEKFIMSQDNLKTYGYPIADVNEEGSVILPTDPRTLNNFKSNNRICCRCLKTFTVGEDGVPTRKETCIYHPGRIWSERTGGTFIKIYSCCKNEISAGGCSSSDVHIVDGTGHPEYNKGFVKTKPSKGDNDSPNSCPGIYALDCEMCNTTVGMELTRLTVVDTNCKTVLEMLVKPKNTILDYNTKFSGIKDGDLDDVEDDLQSAQRKLLKLVTSKTILIGHSLDSDLKALKIVHSTVIDTAEVFHHRRGLPFKRALRTIVAEIMHQIIQESDAGHDSKEDAVSCMKLMLMKGTHEMHKMKNKNPNLFDRLFNAT